ncbi:MAG: ureidoglycolate lyase [Pseudanabaenaceae cyanobacterium bins.39]|nr:ureidoglycolate lyase [Pseudanabaenaceae cyanobacterium bins.39]
MTNLPVQSISEIAFRPYGQVIFPCDDGKAFDMQDAQLHLEGIPRFYIMRLAKNAPQFRRLARHRQCTQCLGSVGGQEWFMAVAAPSDHLEISQIEVFRIAGNCFIKLERGTWHAGPMFQQEAIDFYNLELHDTNINDYEVYELDKLYKLDLS